MLITMSKWHIFGRVACVVQMWLLLFMSYVSWSLCVCVSVPLSVSVCVAHKDELGKTDIHIEMPFGAASCGPKGAHDFLTGRATFGGHVPDRYPLYSIRRCGVQ